MLFVLLLLHDFWLLIWYFQTFDNCVVCHSFDARLLITPLVFSNLWSLHCLSFFWCMAYDYSFGIFKPLITVLLLIHGYWLHLWYFQTLDHCIVCPSFGVRLLITHLVCSNLWSLCCLSFWCTASDYSFGIFKHLIIVLVDLLLMHVIWFLLWYCQACGHCVVCLSIDAQLLIIRLVFKTFDHCVVSPSFEARLLITHFVFSSLWSLCCLSFYWCTVSDYSFDIFKTLIFVLVVLLLMHGFWLLLWFFKSLVTVLFVLLLMHDFWLLLWYFQTVDHRAVCPSFNARLLITHLVFSKLWSLCCLSFFLIYGFWLLLWYFRTFDHRACCPHFNVLLLITPLVFQTFGHCVVCPSFDAWHMITPLVFSNLWSLCCFRYTVTDYSFGILKPWITVLW